MENVNMFIDKYLKKLEFSYCPYVKRAENTKMPSTNNFDWVKLVANIKKFTGLDAIIGFAIQPNPKNRTQNHIYFGVMQTMSLL